MKAAIIIEFYFIVINSLRHKIHFPLDDNVNRFLASRVMGCACFEVNF